MKKKVIVVAPTYNEEENIAGFIEAVLSEQKNLSLYNLEILVSDSHSADKTGEIVKKIALKNKNVHYLDVKDRGLGLGLLRGLDFAINKLGANLLVTMEADLSCDPRQLKDFLTKLEKVDLVIGSRYVAGGRITNWSWWRKALSLYANYLLRILSMGWHIHEYTNLYRAFTSSAWLKIRNKVGIHLGWLFVPSFVFEAIDANLSIVEQPIIYFDRFGGRSKMRTISYTKNLLHYALRFRLKKIYGSLS